MFYIEDKCLEDNKNKKDKMLKLESVIDNIELNQEGIQVIYKKMWSIPIYKSNLDINVSKFKDINLIEEFIIKIALSGLTDDVTTKVICDILKLDEVFVEIYTEKLANLGIINKSKLPYIEVTEIGIEQYNKGKILEYDKVYKLDCYLNPKLKLILDNAYQSPNEDVLNMEIEYNNENLQYLENDPVIIEQVIELSKLKKITLNSSNINKHLSNFKVDNFKEIYYFDILEIWIYDIVEKKLYCRVWDMNQEKFNTDISNYIINNKPLTKNDFNIDYKNQPTDINITSKYEENYIKQVKQASTSKTKTNIFKMIRGKDIKIEFNNAFKITKERIYIQSPWISENVVDKEMLKQFRSLVSKGCKIFITWGYSTDINMETRKPPRELIDKLKKIKTQNGLPGVYIYWIGNHHNKEVIVDDKLHLAGSFNWLSYRGDYLPRGESVYATDNKECIEEAKLYIEEQIMIKAYENFMAYDDICDICCLLSLTTHEEEIKQLILSKVNRLIQDNIVDSNKALYDILCVYFKYDIYDELFYKLLNLLINNNYNLDKINEMINNAKKYSKNILSGLNMENLMKLKNYNK